MDIESRLALIKSVGEEIITEEELKALLETKTHPVAYDGFEPSGTSIHIAQGLLRAININKMTEAGCRFKILVADWHAWANNKMGGNLENIQKVGKYLIELWKACGMDTSKVEFVWASDLTKDYEYWKKVMQIARSSTLKRIIRCSQIMGRREDETLQASQILYPCMQCADIFHLKADITQLGMDQRKVNILAREIGPSLGFWKPVIISHHMLSSLLGPEKVGGEIKEIGIGEEEEVLGNYKIKLEKVDDPAARKRKVGGTFNINDTLKTIYGYVEEDETVATIIIISNLNGSLPEDIPLIKGKSVVAPKTGIAIKCLDIDRTGIDKVKIQVSPGKLQLTAVVKMSKSKPETAVLMNDSEDNVIKKINRAYCPEGITKDNPILEYCKYIIFGKKKKLIIERPAKWGGDKEFASYGDIEKAFVAGNLHPADLKRAVGYELNALLTPIRKNLERSKTAKELAREISTFEVTR